MRWLSIPFVFWLLVGSGFAQDLDQLRSRAADHWKKRLSGDRKAAGQFVEKEDRESFINLYEPQVKSAVIDSFRFSDNSREVLVVVKAKIEVPTIGITDKTISERWVWNGNWFLYVGPLAASPFADKPGVTQGPASPSFDLLDSELNLGRHVQGEQIPLTVRFKAKRSEVANIVVRGSDGITIKGTQWENPDGGTIDSVMDASRISTDISQTLTFELIAYSGARVSKTVKVAAQIEGRIRIKQSPEVVDPAISSRIEVEVTNIWSATVKLAGVALYNPAFRLEEDVKTPLELKPGESLRLQILHDAQRVPDNAALFLDFADGLFPKPIVFPLNILIPEEKAFDPANIDPALLQQILRQQGIRQ